ncbi:MAG TPA: sigma-70 family RNA polymerase sigma factor [Marmoricola sp.]|nr:sigma-70 family RNA polymerase sigma factor [Marmoricola sp.]
MIEEVFRDEWSRVLASLVGFLGDLDLAEEVTQEAFALAVERWPRDGAPRNPGAWLTTTARNRAIDRIRRDRVLRTKLPLIVLPEAEEPMRPAAAIPDERLELIFTCCHPALGTEAQVALTLRALGGLSTEEIARAFLVPADTMKRRLTRAKTKIRTAGVPFRVPPDHVLPERLGTVLRVIYLIFNQGYGGTDELATEAIRLGRLLLALMPDEPEAIGLLALMLSHEARRAARAPEGELVRLEEQDRSLWDEAMVTEGRDLVTRALGRPTRGPYAVQAAIAALQNEPAIDWPQVVALYDELVGLTGSPVVELNRAAAIAAAGATERALSIVEHLDLDGYQYLHSTRAELMHRLGRDDEAVEAFRRALELARADHERQFLQRRIDSLAD